MFGSSGSAPHKYCVRVRQMPLIGGEYMEARSRGSKEIIAQKHPRNEGKVLSLDTEKKGDFEYKHKLSKTRLADIFQLPCRPLNRSIQPVLWMSRMRQLLLMMLTEGELVFVRSSNRMLDENPFSFQFEHDKQCFNPTGFVVLRDATSLPPRSILHPCDGA